MVLYYQIVKAEWGILMSSQGTKMPLVILSLPDGRQGTKDLNRLPII